MSCHYSHLLLTFPFQAFQTKGDGQYIIFGAGNNSQFKEVCQASEFLCRLIKDYRESGLNSPAILSLD